MSPAERSAPAGRTWTAAAEAELIRALEDADAGVRQRNPDLAMASIEIAVRIMRDPASRTHNRQLTGSTPEIEEP